MARFLHHLVSSKQKVIALCVAVGLISGLAATLISVEQECEGVRKAVFRLHILANSDSAEDQALKLKVRDAIVAETADLFREARTSAEAEQIALKHTDLLQTVAADTLKENGSNQTVTVTVGQTWFNTREYDDFTLPAGNYEALQIKLGKAEGKNWWCVLFPSVCIPSASGHIGDALTERETKLVTEKARYRPAFFLVELWQRICRRGKI